MTRMSNKPAIAFKAFMSLFISFFGFCAVVQIGTPHRPLFLFPDIPYTYEYGALEILFQALVIVAVLYALFHTWVLKR